MDLSKRCLEGKCLWELKNSFSALLTGSEYQVMSEEDDELEEDYEDDFDEGWEEDLDEDDSE